MDSPALLAPLTIGSLELHFRKFKPAACRSAFDHVASSTISASKGHPHRNHAVSPH